MNNDHFQQLVSNWLDGSLTQTESADLQNELAESASRRDEFADLCGLDSDLRLMSDDLVTVGPAKDSPEPRAFKTRSTTLAWLAAIAAALLLAVGYGIGRDRQPDLTSPIVESSGAPDQINEGVESGCAVLSRIVDAKFSHGRIYQEGDSLPPGPLQLVSGAAQVDFFSGATMLMDAATEVNLVSAWEAECVRGKVTMHVPPPAIGFRLILPGMKVVDLGTEFGVEVDGSDSSLHVFDGEVEAYVPGSNMQVVREGESLETSNSQSPVSGQATPDDFPSAKQFEQRIDAFHQQKSVKWWASMKRVRTDARVLGCYLFKRWDDDRWNRLVNSFSLPRVPSRNGSAVGTRWVEGRWPTKAAMEFKSPGDRVRINPGDAMYDGLTLACWVRIDGLDRKYNALLLSDGYEDGEPHWQIDETGRLLFSVSYWRPASSEEPKTEAYRENQRYYTPPIMVPGGRRWHHVAVTYSATTGEAIQYLDGQEVSREISEHHQSGRKITFGPCEIGNWGLPRENATFPIRNLNGRVDEFLIYQEPLSSDEITDLYRLGIPN